MAETVSSCTSVQGPLPESLRRGVQEAYDFKEYGAFMKIVCSVQIGSISSEIANGKVFQILGWSGGETPFSIKGENHNTPGRCDRPDLYQLFTQWSAPVAAGTVCFDFMSTETLIKDLNSLDTTLAMIIPTLEMRNLHVFGVTLETITYPAIFISALETMIEQAKDVGGNDPICKKTLTTFHRSQFEKQRYVGHRVSIAFAEDYESSCHVVFPCDTTVAQKNTKSVCAIKMTDLELSLPWLLEKTSLFAQYRLDIRSQLHLHAVYQRKADDKNMRKAFNPQLAGQKTETKTSATVPETYKTTPWNSITETRHLTQVQFNLKQLAGIAALDTAKKNHEDVSRQHYNYTEENLRKTMQALTACSPTMQIALRSGVGTPRVAVSVRAVRLLWERELKRRSTLSALHPADGLAS